MRAPLHVVVLGAGFAGLETLFQLRHRLGRRVRLTLVTDDARFLFRPNTIYVPFGLEPAALEVALEEPLARRDVALVQGRARAFDPVTRVVELAGGARVNYDVLVLATGARAAAGEVPGLEEHAVSLWTPGGMRALGDRLDRAERRARSGLPTRMLFALPAGNQCPGPLFELVQMADVHLRRRGARDAVELTWASPGEHLLPGFGPRLHERAARDLRRRGIATHRGAALARVEPGVAVFATGLRLDFDEVVTFPAAVAAVAWEGVARDARGFIRCEAASRRAVGLADVYAPGDAGDFPLKQAFLALLQAGAVAEDIAARVEGRAPEAGFDPVALCVLEALDTATFAQVPLRVVGGGVGGVGGVGANEAAQVERRAEADLERADLYRVGRGRAWRACKRGFGVYARRRYAAGEPFCAGAAWSVVDLGLRVMREVLAE